MTHFKAKVHDPGVISTIGKHFTIHSTSVGVTIFLSYHVCANV